MTSLAQLCQAEMRRSAGQQGSRDGQHLIPPADLCERLAVPGPASPTAEIGAQFLVLTPSPFVPSHSAPCVMTGTRSGENRTNIVVNNQFQYSPVKSDPRSLGLDRVRSRSPGFSVGLALSPYGGGYMDRQTSLYNLAVLSSNAT